MPDEQTVSPFAAFATQGAIQVVKQAPPALAPDPIGTQPEIVDRDEDDEDDSPSARLVQMAGYLRETLASAAAAAQTPQELGAVVAQGFGLIADGLDAAAEMEPDDELVEYLSEENREILKGCLGMAGALLMMLDMEGRRGLRAFRDTLNAEQKTHLDALLAQFGPMLNESLQRLAVLTQASVALEDDDDEDDDDEDDDDEDDDDGEEDAAQRPATPKRGK
jgi:hypothetical protein